MEQKEIGLQISTTGEHFGTMVDENNILKLTRNEDGTYMTEGFWISDVIDLGDKFADFGKVFVTDITNSNSLCTIETKTSSDGVIFDDYVAVAMDGTIQSETHQFVQVKITLYAGYSNVVDILDYSNFELNEYVELDGSNKIKLKANYEFDMSKDESWSEQGTLHSLRFEISKWGKINSLKIK